MHSRHSHVPHLPHRYADLHTKFGAPYTYLPLNKYRSVFVTDRLERPDVPGPSNEGAAIIMGNSVRQWHASYWPTRRQTQARQAVEGMEAYRQHLLALSNDSHNLPGAT